MTPDINLRSFVGPQDDGVRFTDAQLDGTGYADALKCSNLRNAFFARLAIIGGSEDSCDVNRGANLTFSHCQLIPKGRYACTLKGGLTGFILEDVTIDGHGTEADIDIGNFSDQAPRFNQRTTGGKLTRVRMQDGSPVVVRILNGDKPVIEDCGPIRWIIVPRALVWFWWTFRRNRWIP